MLEMRTRTTSAGQPLLSRARQVDLGLPKRAQSGYGSDLAGERDKLAFYVSYSDYGWFLVRFDLATGTPRMLKGLGGELRGSLLDPARGTRHLATTHELCEFDPERFKIVRRMKLRGFPNRLVHTPDPDVVLVSWGDQAFGKLVSLKDYAPLGDVRMKGVDAATTHNDTLTLVSFALGVARPIDAAGKLAKKTIDVPVMKHPVFTSDAICGIDDQGLVVVDRETLALRGRVAIDGAAYVLGLDARGRLVVHVHEGIALVDLSEMRLATQIKMTTPLWSGALVGPSTLATWTKNQPSEVIVVEWDEDAQRPVVPTRPLNVKEPPPPVVESRGRTIITKQIYQHRRVDSARIVDTTFTRCKFDDCSLGELFERAKGTARTVVRGVQAIRCIFRSTHVRHIAFEDCLLDSPTVTLGASLAGCTFNRVVIRGRLGLTTIEPWAAREDDDTPQTRAVDRAIADYYRDVAWALDIREADASDLRIESIPLRLVRRDPERQLLPRPEQVSHPAWKSAVVAEAFWVFDLARDVQRNGAIFLIHARDTAREVERQAALSELRAAGVLDEVTGVV